MKKNIIYLITLITAVIALIVAIVNYKTAKTNQKTKKEFDNIEVLNKTNNNSHKVVKEFLNSKPSYEDIKKNNKEDFFNTQPTWEK